MAVHNGYSSMAKPGITRDVAHQRSNHLPSRAMSSSHGQARLPGSMTSSGSTVAAARPRRPANTSPNAASTIAAIAGTVAAMRL